MVIRVEVESGYSTVVVDPLITDEHNAVNQAGVCIVRGPRDPDAGNAVCLIEEVRRLEVV